MDSKNEQGYDSGDISIASNRPRRFSKVIRKGVIFTLIIGLLAGFGSAWYLRGRTISDLNHQLHSKSGELEELQSTIGNLGDCADSDGYYYSGDCPDIAIIKTSRMDDPKLTANEQFIVVEIELANNHKESVSFSSDRAKLKDSNNYVFPASAISEYDYKNDDDIVYESLSEVSNILETYEMHLAPGEKIRGNLVFKVNKSAESFYLSYYKVKTEEFKP